MSEASTPVINVDHNELAKFALLAEDWWNEHGECKPLHDLNPLRTAFIAERARLDGARVLDVGCGGGILSEALARLGVTVTGIDANADLIEVARLHAARAGLKNLDYECTSVEEFTASHAASFDIVTCMELLEHVPQPAQMVDACRDCAAPDGTVFFSTINRTAKAYAQAVVGAEYVLRLLPRGTHDYARFIKPSELARWCRASTLEVREIAGMSYNPFNGRASLCDDRGVNYLVHCVRRA
ncbi:MAG: bifunctional 2-polyprenyl-6-hydroxyphenol methylase/3-demethylubiquinol 3-O-methyltransferase UbiG [Gammaproteobacteria bacterium]